MLSFGVLHVQVKKLQAVGGKSPPKRFRTSESLFLAEVKSLFLLRTSEVLNN